MRIYLPTDNPQSRGYSGSHKGYDFRGANLPDEVRVGKNGTIVQRIDDFSANWTNDGTLTTRDYGNFIKVQHDDGTFAIFAHLRKGSSYYVGTKVKEGQIIARIGNTGNSTGPHLHAEYRNAQDVNEPAEFFTKGASDQKPDTAFETMVKKSTQWDETCREYELGDPNHTLVEKLKQYVGGLKSRITDLDNQVVRERTEKGNREEQVSRLKKDLLEANKREIGLVGQLNVVLKEPARFKGGI